MSKIRISQPTFDSETGEQYEAGTVLDLGAKRNKAAVDSYQAVYVDSEKLEKELKDTGKNLDDKPIVSEKVEVDMPKGPKSKVSKAGSKEIQTK